MKVVVISVFLAVSLTWGLRQIDLDAEIIRYVILGIFVLFMVIIFGTMLLFTNYQLVIRSKRVMILGISLFLTTDFLNWKENTFLKMADIALPISIGLMVVFVLYGLLYYKLVEREIFDKRLLDEGKLEIDATNVDTTKQSLQDSVAEWILPKYKGKIGVLTEGFVTYKKGQRQAIVSIFMMDKDNKKQRLPQKLFEFPVNFN